MLKVPLGTWLLITLAATASLLLPVYRARWRDELALLLPLAVILVFVSAQTGFSHHLRYVLSIFPLAFIWMSKVFFVGAAPDGDRLIRRVAFVALLWSVASSLWIYPHSLAYFNELAGGPRHGVDYLGAPAVDSNLDWGQDWLYLKRWLDGHPEARPMRIVVTGVMDARVLGFPEDHTRGQPAPGWYALSVAPVYDVHRAWRDFQHPRPAAMAGYSIRIYHVTAENATGDVTPHVSN